MGIKTNLSISVSDWCVRMKMATMISIGWESNDSMPKINKIEKEKY